MGFQNPSKEFMQEEGMLTVLSATNLVSQVTGEVQIDGQIQQHLGHDSSLKECYCNSGGSIKWVYHKMGERT